MMGTKKSTENGEADDLALWMSGLGTMAVHMRMRWRVLPPLRVTTLLIPITGSPFLRLHILSLIYRQASLTNRSRLVKNDFYDCCLGPKTKLAFKVNNWLQQQLSHTYAVQLVIYGHALAKHAWRARFVKLDFLLYGCHNEQFFFCFQLTKKATTVLSVGLNLLLVKWCLKYVKKK